MTTWDMDKYNLVKPALWQDENGVFISLDHQRPIGVNGQSLSEYYGGGHSTTPKITTEPPVTTTAAPETTVTEHVTTVTEPVTTVTEPATTKAPETTTEGETGVTAVIYGDTDCSGMVDVSDAVLLARVITEDQAAVITDKGRRNADANRNGNLDPDDITAILRHIAKIEILPVAN